LHAEIAEDLVEGAHELRRRLFAGRGADDIGSLPPQPAPLGEQIGQLQEIGDPIEKHLHRRADGIPIDRRRKDDLVVCQNVLHDRLEVVIPVAMVVVERR
jgi:hypothetical protein